MTESCNVREITEPVAETCGCMGQEVLAFFAIPALDKKM